MDAVRLYTGNPYAVQCHTLSISVLCLLCKLYYGQELCVNQYPCTILHPNIRHPEKLSIQYDQAEMQS